MIVAHCFERQIRHRTYLMCETSVTSGMNPPCPTPAPLFETTGRETVEELQARARDAILAGRPDLAFLHALKPEPGDPGRIGGSPTLRFDLAFAPKPDTKGRSK